MLKFIRLVLANKSTLFQSIVIMLKFDGIGSLPSNDISASQHGI